MNGQQLYILRVSDHWETFLVRSSRWCKGAQFTAVFEKLAIRVYLKLNIEKISQWVFPR